MAKKKKSRKAAYSEFFFGTPRKFVATLVGAILMILLLPLLVSSLVTGLNSLVVWALSIIIPVGALMLIFRVVTSRK